MTALFAAASLANALLLFLVQPMTAKALLPFFGGTAAVWTACMLFYQAVLLAGYAYAHRLGRLPPRVQAAAHLGLLAAAALALPPGPPAGWSPEPGAGVGALLLVLTRAVGLPLLALAAGAPLLQRWYARAGARRSGDPYFLYAASNAGSLMALLAYPFAVEPLLDLGGQGRVWSWGYGALWLLWAACARYSASAKAAEPAAPPAAVGVWRERLLWGALAAVPSSLMLAVTAHITIDIAPVPLLWVVPLAVYLATYIAAFSGAGPAFTRWCAVASPLIGMGWAFAGIFDLMTKTNLALHLGVLAVLAGALHGRLAGARPGPARLTEYYLCTAAGGVVGGLFNGVLAPLVFSGLREYGLAMVAAMLLLPDEALPTQPPGEPAPARRPWLVSAGVVAGAVGAAALGLLVEWGPVSALFARVTEATGGRLDEPFFDMLGAVYLILVPSALVYHLARRPAELRAGVAALMGFFALRGVAIDSRLVITRERDFYGVLTVKEDRTGRWTTLTHGNTIHGRQSLDPAMREEPLTYFHRKGPSGDLVAAMLAGRGKAPARMAVVGLGAGSLAAYPRRGDSITFYELDPAVERLARKHFTYLADAEYRGASVSVVCGDARLSLAREEGERYDLLMVDAFSSDSIPVHLVTQEALELYRRRVSEKGLIAFHVTNRHLRLARAFARLAAESGMAVARRRDTDNTSYGKLTSEWVVLATDAEALQPLAELGNWQGMVPMAGDPLWTDSFSSLLPLLK
ncbi:MAG: fused MFS/spermidine synthase [Elusimicrobia bacterium]|nr:fused MFS/spermidine synthase [Elusimicrobiota bacterium]